MIDFAVLSPPFFSTAGEVLPCFLRLKTAHPLTSVEFINFWTCSVNAGDSYVLLSFALLADRRDRDTLEIPPVGLIAFNCVGSDAISPSPFPELAFGAMSLSLGRCRRVIEHECRRRASLGCLPATSSMPASN